MPLGAALGFGAMACALTLWLLDWAGGDAAPWPSCTATAPLALFGLYMALHFIALALYALLEKDLDP